MKIAADQHRAAARIAGNINACRRKANLIAQQFDGAPFT